MLCTSLLDTALIDGMLLVSAWIDTKVCTFHLHKLSCPTRYKVKVTNFESKEFRPVITYWKRKCHIICHLFPRQIVLSMKPYNCSSKWLALTRCLAFISTLTGGAGNFHCHNVLLWQEQKHMNLTNEFSLLPGIIRPKCIKVWSHIKTFKTTHDHDNEAGFILRHQFSSIHSVLHQVILLLSALFLLLPK